VSRGVGPQVSNGPDSIAQRVRSLGVSGDDAGICHHPRRDPLINIPVRMASTQSAVLECDGPDPMWPTTDAHHDS